MPEPRKYRRGLLDLLLEPPALDEDYKAYARGERDEPAKRMYEDIKTSPFTRLFSPQRTAIAKGGNQAYLEGLTETRLSRDDFEKRQNLQELIRNRGFNMQAAENRDAAKRERDYKTSEREKVEAAAKVTAGEQRAFEAEESKLDRQAQRDLTAQGLGAKAQERREDKAAEKAQAKALTQLPSYKLAAERSEYWLDRLESAENPAEKRKILEEMEQLGKTPTLNSLTGEYELGIIEKTDKSAAASGATTSDDIVKEHVGDGNYDNKYQGYRAAKAELLRKWKAVNQEVVRTKAAVSRKVYSTSGRAPLVPLPKTPTTREQESDAARAAVEEQERVWPIYSKQLETLNRKLNLSPDHGTPTTAPPSLQ